nr:MAG TPA: hypothetical protein [Caudoviricetes sp.]
MHDYSAYTCSLILLIYFVVLLSFSFVDWRSNVDKSHHPPKKWRVRGYGCPTIPAVQDF